MQPLAGVGGPSGSVQCGACWPAFSEEDGGLAQSQCSGHLAVIGVLGVRAAAHVVTWLITSSDTWPSNAAVG